MIQNRPPMGWNTWNTFAQNINEQLILEAADKIIELGLKDCGYEYVVIDDCWALKKRNKEGRLVADPEKFPHGMKWLSDEIHKRGLKFGMYSCAGTLTCAQYPASYDREFIDAQTFAEWGVDFLKYDYCFHSNIVPIDVLYRRMGLALANCGRDILFSACSWGTKETEKWVKTTGSHMWRSTPDIHDTWQSIKNLFLKQESIFGYNGKGCFNDMDMLVIGMHGKGNVGVTGCSDDEYRTHMNAWCLFASPLMIGCDIRNMDDATKTILMNKELIAIDQDEACRQVFRVEEGWSNPDLPIYARFLENGDIAVGVFNMSDVDKVVFFGIEEMGLPLVSGKTLIMRNVWTGEETTIDNEMVTVKLAAHASNVYRCRVVDAN